MVLYGNVFTMLSRMADGSIVGRLVAPESVKIEDGEHTVRLPHPTTPLDPKAVVSALRSYERTYGKLR